MTSRTRIARLAALVLAVALLPIMGTAGAQTACPCTIWDAGVSPGTVTDPDRKAIEVGVRFRSSQDGVVTGVRFYKGAGNTGTHVGNLWSNTGANLATATFAGETASGWQQVTFASPVPVTAGTTYVASYHAPVGRYSVDDDYFATAGVTRGPLTALPNGVDGANGVYRYGTSAFPTQSYRSSNYWVDVLFQTSSTPPPPDTTPPTVTGRSPAPGATGVPVGGDVTATFSEPVQPASLAMELRASGGALVPGAVSYDAASRTGRLNPDAELAVSTTYTASVTGATDTAGNTLTGPVTWTFTTAAAPPPPPPPGTCPCTIWPDTAMPAVPAQTDSSAVELGVRFRSAQDGFITGVRFYKGPGNTGTHVGNLWSNTGTNLATATFTGETASGWQQVSFASPVPVTAGTTYVASYHAPVGRYATNNDFFATAGVTRGPLTAQRNGENGANGVYRYGGSAFPTATYRSTNYWVDVVFNTVAADATPPTVTGRSPGVGATGVVVGSDVTATFSEPVQPGSVAMELRGPGGALVPAALSYDAASRTARLNPEADLAFTTAYTASVTGAVDTAGNALAGPVTWTFTTGGTPPPPLDQGPGGPVLVVTGSSPFTRYYAEILRTEGLNAFATAGIGSVTPALLAGHDVVVLGETPLTAAQVTMLSDWVNAGGNLIAMRPDKQLAGLLGLTDAGGTLADAYLRVDTSAAPGAGIVADSVQYHGTADRYTLAGAAAVATLHSTATTATPHPAVTVVDRGAAGGQAAAFAFDLARSVVLSRQGNPAWEGQERDSRAPIRSNDLFFGGASAADWVDLTRVAIPQADEQQRLLANLIQDLNADRKPLPRFWYFPRNEKAVVIATGDDHATGGTRGRFARYEANSPVGCQPGAWECLRLTSYVYPNAPLTPADAATYTGRGFEVGLHPTTSCSNFTPSSLTSVFSTQLAQFAQRYTSIPAPQTNRTHCLVWSDWSTHAEVERANGIRLDTNYYYWPGAWVQNRPGFFTGSGMPMRFADRTGSMLDIYQATTQMTDESEQTYPFTPNTLLDRALGPEGYYGAFTANMHTDREATPQDDALVASARARGVPMVTARQMLAWLDGRNASRMTGIGWSGDTLTFGVTLGAGADGLTLMIPTAGPSGLLSGLTRDGGALSFTEETIKGVRYAVVDSLPGTYRATYGAPAAAPAVAATQALAEPDGTATVSWSTDVPADSTVRYGTSPDALNSEARAAGPVTEHAVTLPDLEDGQTYHYMVGSAAQAGSTGTFTTPPADTAAPVIADVAVSAQPDGTATVTWTTDEGADAAVEVAGPGFAPGTLPAHEGSETVHTALVTGLEPRAGYTVRAVSSDPAGNVATTEPVAFTTPGLGVVDSTAPEFREGRGAYLAETGDGELTTPPIEGEEFSDADLPGGWTTSGRLRRGTVEVGGDGLRVDGATVIGRTAVSAGRTLSAEATLSADGQSLGLGAAGRGGRDEAVFAVRGGELVARTAGAGRQQTALPADLLGAPHVYTVERSASGVVYAVDGREVARHDVGLGGALRVVVADRRPDEGAVEVGWTRITGGRAEGTFTSRVLDAGAFVTWDRASWTADVPAGADLRVSVRTGSTATPDDTWSAFSPVTADTVIGEASRFIQYRVELAAGPSGDAPVLYDVALTHDGQPAAPEPPG